MGQVPCTRGQAYWDGASIHHSISQNNYSPNRIIHGTTIYFAPIHPNCYGHALLDGVFTLYTLLRENHLEDQSSTNLFLVVSQSDSQGKTFLNILQLIRDIFNFKQIIFSNEEKLHFQDLIYQNWNANGFFVSHPDSFKFIRKLCEFGFQENIIFQDVDHKRDIVNDFVDHILSAYHINHYDYPIIKNRVLIPLRLYNRKILNLNELEFALKNDVYNPAILDMEALSIKQQIIEVIQSEYLLGTYGSNLTNGIFLPPSGKMVVLWPRHGKYFITRNYCIIYSAVLYAGITVAEYDKPEYDQRDEYLNPESIPFPVNWFHKEGKILVLDPNVTLNQIVQQPHPLFYHLFHVNLYVNPGDVIATLNKCRSN